MKSNKRKLSGWDNVKLQKKKVQEDLQLSSFMAKWQRQRTANNNNEEISGSDAKEENIVSTSNNGLSSDGSSSATLQNAPAPLSSNPEGAENQNKILDVPPCKNQPLQVPPFKAGGQAHNFIPKWYTDFPWLHFVETDKVMVCFICVQAQSKELMPKTDKAVSKLSTGEGFKNWKKAGNVFKNHQSSEYHKTAVVKLDAFLSTPVTTLIDGSRCIEQKEAAKALQVMFESILFLGRQGLALRGTKSDSGNYVNLVEFLGRHVPELKTFLERKKNNLSPEIQNEMVEIAAHFVLRDVVKKIKESEAICLIVDETSDISGHEQVSINIRTVDDNLDVEEWFLGLYETSEMTGKALFDLIMDALKRFDISLDRLRGQTYDGGRNMSGAKQGVQKRIIDKQPLAMYIHCLNHCLNLALQDAAKAVPLVRDTMQWTNDIGVVIRNSPKRMQRFQDIAVASKDTENGGKIALAPVPRPLCPTRFSVRTPALTTLRVEYPHVIELLDELADSRDDIASKARGLHDQLLKSEIYFGVLMCHQIFEPCERLSVSLQSKTETVSGAIEAAAATREELEKMRNENHFNKLWADMEEKITEFDLCPPRVPRKRQVPKKLEQSTNASENYNFDEAKKKMRVVYYEALDAVIGEIDSRFFQKGIEDYKHLESSILTGPEDWSPELCATLDKYGIHKDHLQSQLPSFNEVIKDRKTLKTIISGFRALSPETRGLFPEVLKVLKLLMVVAPSSATAERSFSMLKRIKTYLRATMTQVRLNHLAVLNAYKDLVRLIDVRALCREFVNKNYRVTVFGGVNQQ